MPDELLGRLRRFQERCFPPFAQHFRGLVSGGARATTLFIGCSDSRIVPHLLTDTGPGELFVVRNAGNFVPPYDMSHGFHGTAASIEFALHQLPIRDIVVCGHSHCGAIRALYQEPRADAPHMNKWLELAREAVLPVTVSEEALRRTEQRSIVLQLTRLMEYPAVAQRLERGELFLHGWHYIIEDGKVLIFDVQRGRFSALDALAA